MLEDGLARLRSLGIERDIGACLYNMALLARAEGRTAEAAELAGEGLAIKHATDELFDLAQCLELMAGVAADAGLGARGGAGARRGGGVAADHRGSSERRRTGGRRDLRDCRAAPWVARRWPPASPRARRGRSSTRWPRRPRSRRSCRRLRTPASSRRSRRPVSASLSPAAQRLRLTARELEVLGYLVQRYTDREIAGGVDDQPPHGDDACRADPHQARRRRSAAGRDRGDPAGLLAS